MKRKSIVKDKIPYLWYLLQSVYINFKLLPFRQAIKMPILTIRPKLGSVKGKVEIDDAVCKFGVIKLGEWGVKAFPNSGITINMQGGTWKVHGKVWIGANSSLEIGRNGILETGDDLLAGTSLKLFCYRKIEIGESQRFGWNCTVMDTNFHPLKKKETGEKKPGGAPIKLGNHNWCATNNVVMPGVKTPDWCIFGYGSVLTRGMECEEYGVHGGSPVRVLSRGFYRDVEDDLDSAVYGPFEN